MNNQVKHPKAFYVQYCRFLKPYAVGLERCRGRLASNSTMVSSHQHQKTSFFLFMLPVEDSDIRGLMSHQHQRRHELVYDFKLKCTRFSKQLEIYLWTPTRQHSYVSHTFGLRILIL